MACTATEYPILPPQTPLSKSDDIYTKPLNDAPPVLHKSTSSITASTSLTDVDGSLFSPVSTRSIASSTTSRSIQRHASKSKILLFHPSIKTPSNARKLEDVRFVTILYNPASGNKRGEKVMQQAVTKFQAYGLEVTTIQLLYLFPHSFPLLLSTSPMLS